MTGAAGMQATALTAVERLGVVRRLGPQRRFGYVETTDAQGQRLNLIFVAGCAATHRVMAQLQVGSRVLVRVADDRRVVDLGLATWEKVRRQ